MIGEYVAPSIKVIDNAIDNSDEIIAIAKAAPEGMWRDSSIDSVKFDEYDKTIRNSREISLAYSLMAPKELFVLAQVIYQHARIYCAENEVGISHMEGINMLEYAPSEGFFDRHSDGGRMNPRAMSALLYLNDVEEGGGTWFDKFSLMINPEKGKLVLFPANYPYSHQAMPPISGYKYVAVTWFGMDLDKDAVERYYDDSRR